MAVARHIAICPPMDTCLSLIEEAMKQEECSQPTPHLPCSPAKGNPGGSKAWQEKLGYERAQEKPKLMSSLGLVRTDLFPRIQALMEWRRRRRLRRQRQCKLGSSSAELPSNAVTGSLPICNPANKGLHKKPEKAITSVSMEKKVTKKPVPVPQSNRSTRGKGVKPDVVVASTGRRCVKTEDRVTPPSKGRDKAKAKTVEVARNKRSPAPNTKLRKNSKEEKSTDGSLTPSTSQAWQELPTRRVLRARGPPIIPPVTRGGREERSNRSRRHVTKSARPDAAKSRPKVKRKE